MKRILALGVLAFLAAACSGSNAATAAQGGRTRFLLLAHQPLAGTVAHWPDARLLDLGQRACASMDRHVAADQIVADLGGNPEPGSADFNAYSFILVDAAMQLCPAHKQEYSAGTAGLTG